MKPTKERRLPTSRPRRTKMTNEARSSREGTRACAWRKSFWRKGWRGASSRCPGTLRGPACPLRPRGPARVPTRALTSTGRTTRAESLRRWSSASPRRPSRKTTRARTPRGRAAAGSSVRRGDGEGTCVVKEGGGGGRHVVGWAEERVGEHRVAASADRIRRGVARRRRGVARGGLETGVCVWAHGGRWGHRAPRGL